MRPMTLALSIAFVAATAGAAGAEVNIHIGVPAPVVVAPAPPPIVVAPPRQVVVAPPPAIVAQPQFVVVPGTNVYHVPNAGFNVFVFGGKYYSHHYDQWFVASSHTGHWRPVSMNHVPRPVLAVPVTYYRIPPGHAHGHKHHRRGWND